MAIVELRDGTPVEVRKSAEQPRRELFNPRLVDGGRQDFVRWDVRWDGKVIGTVESWRSASWRKSGRIRTSLRGHTKYWKEELAVAVLRENGCEWDRNGSRYLYTRRAAIERLVERYRELPQLCSICQGEERDPAPETTCARCRKGRTRR